MTLSSILTSINALYIVIIYSFLYLFAMTQKQTALSQTHAQAKTREVDKWVVLKLNNMRNTWPSQNAGRMPAKSKLLFCGTRVRNQSYITITIIITRFTILTSHGWNEMASVIFFWCTMLSKIRRVVEVKLINIDHITSKSWGLERGYEYLL